MNQTKPGNTESRHSNPSSEDHEHCPVRENDQCVDEVPNLPKRSQLHETMEKKIIIIIIKFIAIYETQSSGKEPYSYKNRQRRIRVMKTRNGMRNRERIRDKMRYQRQIICRTIRKREFPLDDRI